MINRSARGDAGIIRLTSDRLHIHSGAQVATATSGLGNGGSLFITAQTANLSGSGLRRASGLFARGAGGNGGPIQVTARELNVTEGAQINSSTVGPGNGGFVTVQANRMSLTGSAPSGPSGIFSTVSGGGQGTAGQIELKGDQLFVGAGAQVATATSWSGNAGDILIDVGQVELVGQDENGPSGLISTSVLILPPPNVPVPPPSKTGEGGTIQVNADRLIVQDGAVINVSNLPTSVKSAALPGNGAVGNIEIQANSVLLNNGGALNATSRGGDRGNITINSSQNITLRNGSLINSNAEGSATGGNIQLKTPFLIGPALENSDITANATNNFGGRINVDAQNVLGIRPAAQLTPQSDITATSDLGGAFNGEVTVNELNTDPEQGVVNLPNDFIDRSQQLVQGCKSKQTNRFIVTGRGGVPMQATDLLNQSLAWQDLRSRGEVSSTGAMVQLPEVLPDRRIVDANQWIKTPGGLIQIIAQSTPNYASQMMSMTCAGS